MNSVPAKAREIFTVAVEQYLPDQWPNYLDEACGDDPELRNGVELLLEAHIGEESVLDSPAVAPPPTINHPVTERPGDTIGPYKLLQEIGEGGMGVVYMAEQTEPVLRKVALKIIKFGMDTKQVVARFEAERQALAMMNHPNIAKVLDAGATDSGRPYFAMELIRGVPITEYCDKNKLSNQQRLELFIPVCRAIQHAHQKGVIHRDIKPSNVLVTLNDGVALPMVIDFGIAKATNQKLTEKTLFTNYAQMIGTPAYMSPEQAEMSKLDVDTRSDVYSLGVLLYELLTGTTPFPTKELLSRGFGEMQRIIAEQEPQKPSMLMSTMPDEQRTVVAKNRSVDAASLGKLLRGDLDWILMKTLEKDRTRRYETVNGLVADIQHHLNNEPVTAAAPTFRYQLQKFTHKNRKYVRIAAAIAGLLIVTALIASWQAIRATQARREAERARASAQELRLLAEQRQKEAEVARSAEHGQRVLAQENEVSVRRLLYAAEMREAQQALARNDLDRSIKLLERHIPGAGDTDLRGWEWRYLWQKCRSDFSDEIDDLISPVHSLSVSNDGSLLAAGRFGRHDGTNALAVWNIQSHERLPNIPDAKGRVRTAFSPRDNLLAFSSRIQPNKLTHRVFLWNPLSGEIIDEFPLEGTCEGLAFSHDGTTLFAAQYADGKSAVIRRDVTEKAALPPVLAPKLYGTLGLSESFAVDESGKLAAYTTRGAASVEAEVMDLESGEVLWSKPVATGDVVSCLALSADGSILATAGGWRTEDPVLWDSRSGERLSTLPGHMATVKEVLFWPDGKKLATACVDQTIRIWDIKDPLQPSLVDTYRGCRSEVWQLSLLPDGKTLVSGDYDGRILTWDSSRISQREDFDFKLPIRNVRNSVFAADSHSIITLDSQGTVARWSGPHFEFEERLFEAGANLNHCTFLRDRYLATTTVDGQVEIWDLRSRKSLYPKRKVAPYAVGALILDQRRVIVGTVTDAAQFHADVWDLAANERLDRRGLSRETSPFGDVSDDGDWSLIPLDGGGGLLEQQLTGNAGIPIETPHKINYAAFSPDGSLFALGFLFGKGSVYETATLKENSTLAANLRSFHSASFSPDNRRLITTGVRVEGVHLWDIESGQPLLSFESPQVTPKHAVMSPDGNSLLSADEEGFYIRRAPSCEEIADWEDVGPN